jgi:hypothetical protein
MATKNSNGASPARRFFAVLLFYAMAFTTISCGHTHAATSNVSMETVMQAIHDYGNGHQPASTSITGAPPAPAQFTNMLNGPMDRTVVYAGYIAAAFEQSDFARLEMEAQRDRSEQSRLIGGVWKLNDFYDGVAKPRATNGDIDAAYQAQFASIKKWIVAYHDSATARIALAVAYLNYASAARGTGYANAVSGSDWELHAQRTQMALNSLLEATKLKEKCPYWYEAMQLVAINQSWDKPLARELVDQAEAFEPSYYHFYREYANYLLPKWDGAEGDTQAYAEEISARLGGVRGDIVYFEIATFQACQCNPTRIP